MATNVVALRTAMTTATTTTSAETTLPTDNAITVEEEDLPESKTTTTSATTTTTTTSTRHGISIMIEHDEIKQQQQQQLCQQNKRSKLRSETEKYQNDLKNVREDVSVGNNESSVVILVVNGHLEKPESDAFVDKDKQNYQTNNNNKNKNGNNNNNDSNNNNKNKNICNKSQMLLMQPNAAAAAAAATAAAIDVQYNNVAANDDGDDIDYRNYREKSVYAIGGDTSDIETSCVQSQVTKQQQQHNTKHTSNNGAEESEADKEVLLSVTTATATAKSDCKQMLKAVDAKDDDDGEDASAATTEKNQLLNMSELLLSASNAVNLEVGQSDRLEKNIEESGTSLGQQQTLNSRIIKHDNDEAVNGTNDKQHNEHNDDDDYNHVGYDNDDDDHDHVDIDDDDVEKAVAALVVDGASSIGVCKNGPNELRSLVRHKQIQSQSQPLRDSAAAKHFASSPATKAGANEHASALTETVSGYASKETHHVVTIQINSGLNNNNNNNKSNNNSNCSTFSEKKELQKYLDQNYNAKPTTTTTTLKGKQVTVVSLNVANRVALEGDNNTNKDNKLIEKLNNFNSQNINNNCGNLHSKTVHVQADKMVVQKSTASCSPVKSNVITSTPATGGSGGNGNGNGGSGTGNASSVTDLNVSNSSYIYYMVSSGQFSPCETLDSGTCSDLDSGAIGKAASVTGETLIRGNDSGIVVGVGNNDVPKLEMHLKTTKIRINNASADSSSSSSSSASSTSSVNASNTNLHRSEHERAYSLTDSEESESSSLSCDSLHSGEYCVGKLHTQRTERSALATFLPDSLLRDIRDRKFVTNDFITKYGNSENDNATAKGVGNVDGRPSSYTQHNTHDIQQSYIELQQVLEDGNGQVQNAATVTVTTQEPRAKRIGKLCDIGSGGISGNFIDPHLNNRPCKYEADKYYTFHVKEHENCRSFGTAGTVSDVVGNLTSDSNALNVCDGETRGMHEDAFAGYKDIRCGSASSTIRSSKGTVRGVKNRVRNGIATFLQLQQPSVKNYKEKDLGKVVLYTTSMGIIRDTYAKCTNVKKILRTLLIKFEERDVFMSVEYQQEIRERMHSQLISVPQLFVEGQHVGDAETVERLNESGELRQLLKPYKSIATTFTCQTCGGYRLLPCPSCNGSKKSVHRNHFTAEFVALKCMNCDEVGLVKCHNC